MCPNLQETVNLVTFTEGTVQWLHFVCSAEVLTTPHLTFYYFPFPVRLTILFTGFYFRIHILRKGSDKDGVQGHWEFHSINSFCESRQKRLVV